MPTTPGNTNSHLLRSRSKIAPVLEALAARRERVTVELPDGLYTTHLVRADPIGENSYSIGLHDTHLMGKDYKVNKRARISAMVKLLILALLMGSLFAVWTVVA